MGNRHVEVAVGSTDAVTSVVNVIASVSVIVEDAEIMVSIMAVPDVVITVVPTVEVETRLPSEVTVVLITVIAVTTVVVGTGMLTMVEFTTTVSKVVTGSVRVSVMLLGDSVAVSVPNGAVLSRGSSVGEETVMLPVGKGSTGGLPPVWRVVLMDCVCQ